MISTQEHLNWIDYAIIGIIAFSTMISFFRGFIREAISLMAWILGLIVSLKYAIVLQTYFTPWISSEAVRYFITFVALFLMIVFAGLLVNLLIHMLLNKTGMSLTDRFIGIFFGALRGGAIVAVMLLMLTNLGTIADSFALQQSTLAPRFKPILFWLNGFLPKKMKAVTQWVANDFRIHQ
ncbi:MAG: colicin V synthesis protein [Coxiella sp. RIFCSPHIGHO2_12_FULL_42_15]|nr:MAG: colicin V synthesis protein [Coxiella sp. RIFCSPHIGHO2_12_FULL_42_15]